MASTVSTAELRILPTGHIASAKKIAWGVAVLSSGTTNLVTGLSRVDCIVCNGVNGSATEVTCLEVKTDLPCSSGTVQIDGTIVDEGGATTDGGSAYFCWIAIGE